ncbi:hypothetical protein M569_07695, partial [Genlisea aurea]
TALMDMSPSGYIAEITCLSPKATEADLRNFFALCGEIADVEIIRAGDYASTAYVTFRNSYSLETAVLLTGAIIVDQPVCITRWGPDAEEEYDAWTRYDDDSYTSVCYAYRASATPPPSAGEAVSTVSLAQDVVKAMISQGYVLGKDALAKARAFDEAHGLSAAAAAKVAEVSERIGLTNKIFAGMEAARSVDRRYRIYDTTRDAVRAAGRGAASAANAVVSSGYFSRGAIWLSGALDRASRAAAELGARGGN